VGCSPATHRHQGLLLRTRLRVSRSALLFATFFRKAASISAATFACCSWDTERGRVDGLADVLGDGIGVEGVEEADLDDMKSS
jgi:hypothetical protein